VVNNYCREKITKIKIKGFLGDNVKIEILFVLTKN